jgi:hypothetical protein
MRHKLQIPYKIYNFPFKILSIKLILNKIKLIILICISNINY